MDEHAELDMSAAESDTSALLVELGGEIDLANAGALGDALRRSTGPLPTVVDLTAVSFIDSSGIAMMLRVHQYAPIWGAPSPGVASHRARRAPWRSAASSSSSTSTPRRRPHDEAAASFPSQPVTATDWSDAPSCLRSRTTPPPTPPTASSPWPRAIATR